DWALCSPECEQRTRMLEVARRADPDPTGWRDRVRDPSVFDAPLKLQTLADEASFAGQSVQLLGSLGERMHRAHLDPLPFLRRVQQAFPGDFWVNFMLGDLLWQGHPEEGIRYFQAALATRPRSALAHLSLGCALAMGNRMADARDSFLLATQIDPRYANAHTELGRAWQALGDHDQARAALERAVGLDAADYRNHLNLGYVQLDGGKVGDAIAELQQAVRIAPQVAANHDWLGKALTAGNRPDEARAEFDAARRLAPDSPAALLEQRRFVEALALAADAVALEPWSASAHSQFGQCLTRVGRRAEATAQFRTALDLEPGNDFARKQLRGLLTALGRSDEALALCEQAIAAQPDRQQAWDGFAELCLYLGRADDYRRLCGQMLERFAALTDAHECECVGRACLLLPPTADVLPRATQLIDRALAAEPATYAAGAKPCFLFARALADYRAGRFDDAISTLSGDAGSVLPPAPVLLLAMALQRAGNVAAARRLLGMAAVGFDWRPARAIDREAWLCHLLRREAETAIAPELPDWLAGRLHPATDDDRRILLGAWRAAGHDAASTRLYAELLRSNGIPDAVTAAQRYQAVCTAVAASEGTGNDADTLDETGRAQCRAWARQWLADELAVRAREFAAIPPTVLARAPNPLRLWSCCAELEPMRDRAALERLPAAEREEWRLLWSRLTAMLDAAVAGAGPATPVAPAQPSGR
ncbi:MAG TPA: tetratricopeptide repeat protein, partial [Planctomycetota bacterium]|nr:tetratricopeptide repeat protein [Planctomycetota bacterium]